MKGRIHSVETFGTVDGPGIRFVLFMQGCALQCRYCHNPDTWDSHDGYTVSIADVLSDIEPYLPYYRRSGGGITVSGGEPTLQSPFVAELFAACKREWGLHTALDSSGFCDPAHVGQLLGVTDLVLLDLKHIDPDRHMRLTGQSNERTLRMAQSLSDRGQPVWIRHVLVPGVTDDYNDLLKLGAFIGSLKNVAKLEVIPYHRMGVYKWGQLGRPYPLEGVREGNALDVERAASIIRLGAEGA